jgi:hypothetical protein
MIAATSVLFWIFTILVPEYCLALKGDADSMGVSTLGHLIVLISALPAVIILPLATLYWLQYLGRVMVSSAMGETGPPRSPDRNFNGFFSGISPWLIWLILGTFVGALPVLFYWLSLTSPAEINVPIVVLLLTIAIPYSLMALMMTFLHDDTFAAKPWTVIGAMIRVAGSFGLLCAFVAGMFGAFVALAAGVLVLRNHFTWIYIIAGLFCWIVLQWISIVAMRVLGTFYFHHRETLRWHHDHPRWGVAWRL